VELGEIAAWILCGGRGERLDSRVGDRSKTVALVGDTPFLEILVRYVHGQGVCRFVLCAGFRAESVRSIVPDLDAYGELHISVESRPLGTGGAVRHALDVVRSDPLLVLNGDSICPVDLSAMLAGHTERGAKLTLALSPVSAAADYGSVALDSAGRVLSFSEKAPGAGLVNAGVYLIDRSLLSTRSNGEGFSLERDFFPTLVDRSLAYGYIHNGPFFDIGVPARYEKAEEVLSALGLL